jgi:RNA polymerase primary sigma factor
MAPASTPGDNVEDHERPNSARPDGHADPHEAPGRFHALNGDHEELRREIDAGLVQDERLAHELGRPDLLRFRASDAFTESLEHFVLSSGQEQRLVRAAQSGDARARAALVEAYMPLISGMARTYRSGQVHRQELLQEGVVGVLRALERFDVERGVPFWGYASWWVRHAMQQLVSELTRPVVLSDRALRHLARLKQAQHEAVQHDGRNPRHTDLAQRTGLELRQVEDLLATERSPRSLHEPAGSDERELGTFGDLLVDPIAEDVYERTLAAIEVESLHGLLAGLSDRERLVLRARYGLDGDEQSLRDIGDRLGISGERVRQIERRALNKLSARMGADDVADAASHGSHAGSP